LEAGFLGPSVPHHLAVLKAAGLDRRDGNRVLYRLESDRLALVVGKFLSAGRPTQVSVRRRSERP
jgi:DNA-binding transcriptional ArsR family regulator